MPFQYAGGRRFVYTCSQKRREVGGGGGGGSQGNCPGAQAITIRSESYRKLAFNRRLTHSSKLVAYKNRF